MILHRNYLVAILLFTFLSCLGQNEKLDSLRLRIVAKKSKTEKTVFQDHKRIAKEFYRLRKADSVKKYLLVGSGKTNVLHERFYFNKRLSNINFITRDLKEATKYIDSCIKIHDEANDNNLIRQASIEYDLGRVNLVSKKYSNAEQNFLKSLELYSQDSSSEMEVASLHRQLGKLYRRKSYKNFIKAVYHIEKAIELYKTKDKFGNISNLYTDLSSLYIGEKEYKKALIYAHNSLDIEKKLGENADFTIAYSRLGRLYYLIENKNFKLSWRYLTLADQQRNSKELENLMHSKLYWYNHYSLQKKTDSATIFFNQYIKLKDSLNKNILASQVIEIETKYQTEKKEKENLQLKASKAEQELELKKMNEKIIFYSLLSLLFVIISLSLIWLNRIEKRKRKKANEDLKFEAQRSKKLFNSIKRILNTNDEYESLNDASFHSYLMNNLKINEVELVSYIKVVEGKSNKEIADFQNTSVNNIKKRLKKVYEQLKIIKNIDLNLTMQRSDAVKYFQDLYLDYLSLK